MKARLIGAGLLLGALALIATFAWRDTPGGERASGPATGAGRAGSADAELVGPRPPREAVRVPTEAPARSELQDGPAEGIAPEGFGLRVIEAETGAPIAGAEAFATDGPTLLGRTGIDGRLGGLELESDTWILVSADGYASRRVAPPTRAGEVATVELQGGFELDVFVLTSSGDAAPDGSLVILWEGATPPTLRNMAALPERAEDPSPLRTARTADGGAARFTGLAFGADYMLKAICPGEVQVGFHVVDTSASAERLVQLQTSSLLVGAIAPPDELLDPTGSGLGPTGTAYGRRLVPPTSVNGLPPLSAPDQVRFFHQSSRFADLAVGLLESPSTQRLLDSAAFLIFRHARDTAPGAVPGAVPGTVPSTVPSTVPTAEIFVEGRAAGRPLELVPVARLIALTPFESVFGEGTWRRQPLDVESPVAGRFAGYGGFHLAGAGTGGSAEWSLNGIDLDAALDLLVPAWVEAIHVDAAVCRGHPLHEFDREALESGRTLTVSNFALLALRLPSTPLDHFAVGRFELCFLTRNENGELVTDGPLALGAEPAPTHGLIALPARDDLRLLPPENSVIEQLDFYRDADPNLPLEAALTPPLPLEVGKVVRLSIEVVE